MLEPDQINNIHGIDNENEDRKKEHEFILRFTQKVINSLNTLCECIHWTPEFFIKAVVIRKLRQLYDGISSQHYYIFSDYFNFSKIEGTPEVNKGKIQEEKTQEIHISFDSVVLEAIYKVSEKIHWTPERYIEYTVESTIKELFTAIKEGIHEDLFGIYFDFSDMMDILEKLISKEVRE